ncbi:glycosyltransferase family 2 protein [Paenibacillus sp. NEAU-GSW1]|uniref:glycosyltransferase family 2 protein n=1 Tax=Paenibacillus sp. NEAU-GSW1 TaxID=2682486 RepID=UPI0012E17C0A|nr:glycosyltransferase family 2 protein [Paenibacillus sp. NEAU-GSW1]MUT65139.1 glycosyltransferase [Paenibacillus sp. NEAU-GSW1]
MNIQGAGGFLPVSLCMIVKDEEQMLEACLRSALPYVSEIVIADTGSTDGTIAIAKRYGAKVVRTAWKDDFSAARNQALAAASQPWLLVLDADERLEPLPLERWSKLLADRLRSGYYVRIISYIERLGNGEGTVSDLACRLFRNDPRIRFAGAIHEEAATSIIRHYGENAIGFAEAMMLHEGYRPERLSERKKRERNGRIIDAALRHNPDAPSLRYAKGTEYFTYGEWGMAAAWLEPLACELPPDEARTSDVVLKLSHALRAFGRLQEAECWAERGWREKGFADFPDLYEAQAQAMLEGDRADEAAAAYARALEVGMAPLRYTSAPGAGSYRTRCAAGFAEERRYRWQEAANGYAEALQLRPNYWPAWERLLLLGALDAQLRPLGEEAFARFVQSNSGRTGKDGIAESEPLFHLIADAGLELLPSVERIGFAAIGVQRERLLLWRGLRLVQRGDAEAGRALWKQLAEAGGSGRLQREAAAYLAALELRETGGASIEGAARPDEAASRALAEQALLRASAAGLAPAAFARTLLRVRAWPAWQALLAAAPAHEAAAAHALPPLQWCALLAADVPAVSSAYAAQLLRSAAPEPAAPALLAAGAIAAAAGEWPAAAERFAAARDAGPRPWQARAAAAGLAASFAARARMAAAAPAAPELISERELLLRVTSSLYNL